MKIDLFERNMLMHSPMKTIFSPISFICAGISGVVLSLTLFGCGGSKANTPASTQKADTSVLEKTPVFEPVVDTNHAVRWKTIPDSSFSSEAGLSFSGPYSVNSENITAFRGNHHRNSPSRGKINGKPMGLKLEWTFTTRNKSALSGNDGSKYSVIDWGGGSGWTGQPALIQWSRTMKDSLGITRRDFLQDDQAKEVIIGSLSGEVYFIDLASGKATRDPIQIDGPIKGSIAIDPRLNGMLYVGQGISKGKRFGAYLIDMITRKVVLHIPGKDPDADRNWGAFDSNPLLDRSSGKLFWPAENGLLYRINVQDKNKPFVESKLNYSRIGMGRLGLEASMAAIGQYGFIGDNSGNILCIDLQQMKPVWQIDNQDDIDASLIIDREEDRYYLYAGNEVDHRQPYAKSTLRKIDARTGSIVWEVGRVCAGHTLNGRENSGGMLATPLIGKQKGNHIALALFSRPNKTQKADLVAIDKRSGKELYSFRLDAYSWASPVDFYDEDGNMYLFFTDVIGNLYLMNGLTGELLHKTATGLTIESSPIIYNDRIVVGTRGSSILSYKIVTN
ncbi:MAG: hypothetical protein RL750_138 [Bacteroidota bacterium]